MISNTGLLYAKMKAFQDKRENILNDYEKSVELLKRFEGSKGYEEDLKKANDKLEVDLTALRNEYSPVFQMIFGSMMDAIGRRSISAPTTDQVNLLSVLKMKKKVTFEECQRTAEAVKDNPIAVSIVTEIAHDHGILNSFDYLCPEMSSQRASDIVMGMKSYTNDFLRYYTTKASRLAKQYHEDKYGTTDFQPIKRRLFDNMDQFYEEIGITGETRKQFSDIVDTVLPEIVQDQKTEVEG